MGAGETMTTNQPRAIRRTAMTLAAALLLVGIGRATADAKATLRWKFKEGEVLHYSMDQNTVSTGQDPEGHEVKQTYGLIMDMTWAIKAVDPSGSASMALSIDRVRTSMTAPFGKFTADSKDFGNIADSKGAINAPGPAAPLFKILVGAEFSARMSPRGELTEIKLSDKLLATLKNDADATLAQGPFSEAGLKNIIAQMVMPLAEAGVDSGETWKRSLAVPAGPEGQTRKIEQTFTYKGQDPAAAGLEVVEYTTRLEPPKADPNVPVTYKKETQVGKFDFDNASGRVVKSTAEEEIEVSIAVQGKEIPQKVLISRVLTLSKDKAP
jgi:hypothetical protein